MGTIVEKEQYTLATKEAIRQAIIAQRVEVPEDTTFRAYAEKITDIPSIVIEDMSYYFYKGIRMEQFDEANKKLCPYAKKMDYMFYDVAYDGDLTGREIASVHTQNCESMKYMFAFLNYTTGGLDTAPEMDTSKVKDFTQMFRKNGALLLVPVYDTSNGEYFDGIFYECPLIQELPELNYENALSMKEAFAYCTNLRSLIVKNTGKCKNMNSMFRECTYLETPPVVDMTSCENSGYMYCDCNAMTEIGGISAPVCTMANYMFFRCKALTKIDGLSLPVATNVGYLCQYDSALKEILNLDISSAKTTTSMFASTALERLTFDSNATDCPSFSIKSLPFTRDSLIEMFESLPDRTGKASANTITVTGCTGTAQLTEEDILIATNKNYVITT